MSEKQSIVQRPIHVSWLGNEWILVQVEGGSQERFYLPGLLAEYVNHNDDVKNTLDVTVPGYVADARTVAWLKVYIDNYLQGLLWQDPVINELDTPPSAPSEGHRYLVGATPTDDWETHAGEIAVYESATWTFESPVTRWALLIEHDNRQLVYYETGWVLVGLAKVNKVTQGTEGNLVVLDSSGGIADSMLDPTSFEVADPNILKRSHVVNDPSTGGTDIPASAEQLKLVAAQVASLANGSPAGVYATVLALETAFPTGDTKVYVVEADGSWYYWSGSAWTAGGAYLANQVPDGSTMYRRSDSIQTGIDGMKYYAITLEEA